MGRKQYRFVEDMTGKGKEASTMNLNVEQECRMW
jgi:hypothetical protein